MPAGLEARACHEYESRMLMSGQLWQHRLVVGFLRQGGMVFGETVRAHRRRLGMSQEDLSGKARIGVRTIRDIEAGRSGTPRPATIRLLADAFGLHGPERDHFHELAHHHATSRATAGTAKVVTSTSDHDDTVGGAVEELLPHIGEDEAAARASSSRPAANGQGPPPAADSSLQPASDEGIHPRRSRISLLARHGEAPMSTNDVDLVDNGWWAGATLGVARGARWSFGAAVRRCVLALIIRLAQGAGPLNDRRSLARTSALWVSLMSIPTVVLALCMLAIGERGQSIVTVLAVPLGIYVISVALMMGLRSSSLASLAMGGRRKPMIGAAAVALGMVIPAAAWWGTTRNSDLDIRLGSSFQLTDGESQLVEATPAQAEWEGRLAFTPWLASNSVANDCVLPTSLIIAPEVDGKLLDSKRARHGQRVSLPIPASTRQVRVRIEYVDPENQGCLVTVTLSGAVLER